MAISQGFRDNILMKKQMKIGFIIVNVFEREKMQRFNYNLTKNLKSLSFQINLLILYYI